MANKKRNALEQAKQIFIQEVKDRLPEALESMSILKNEGYNSNATEKLYRFAHTLKGSGQMVNLHDIADPAIEMLSALLLMKDYGVDLEKGIIKFLEERIEEIIYYTDNHTSKPLITNVQTLNTSKKIFVIDDEQSVTDFIKNALESRGYKVNVYNDIFKAEKELYTENPDLIVLDIVMSTEEDGIVFCRKIRSDYNLKLMPIVFLSKKNDLRDKLEGFATGADDYLCKPFEIEELVARIQAILNRLETQKKLILQDDLTGVYNRRYLEQRLVEEISKSERIDGSFSIAMVDLDYFKRINDEYGHAAGDEVLQYIAKTMNENLRASDLVCRYGGEEFIIIFPDTIKEDTYNVVERLRKSISMTPIRLKKNGTEINMTISAGISSYPKDGITSKEIINSADSAMYEAKSKGRNRVFISRGEKND